MVEGSLRQQLARAMDAHTFPRWSKVSAEVMPLIWPLIESALAAARQETASENERLRAELDQRRQLLSEWFALWEESSDAPVKLPNALHVRTALTLNTPDLVPAYEVTEEGFCSCFPVGFPPASYAPDCGIAEHRSRAALARETAGKETDNG